MGNIDGINNNIDWTAPQRAAETARVNATAKQEAKNAWAWRRHAEGLNKRCIEALKGQHLALAQKEAWKMTAKQLWDRLFGGKKGHEELMAIAKANREIVLREHPYRGPT